MEVELNLRASLMQNNEVKFLIRYEVDSSDAYSMMSKYRFTRVLFNLESHFAFVVKKHVHLSTKKANEHIVNLQIVDNILPSSIY
jgi:hypothetical protein